MTSALLDRSVPPAAGRVRPFHFPPFLRHRLANGLEILAARLTAFPLVSLELVTPAGGQQDPSGKEGLAALTAGVIDEGTRRRNALEIAAHVEQLGGYFVAGVDWDEGYLATGLLAPHLHAGLELLAEVATEPTFPEAEIERLRKQRLTELLRRGQDPGLLAEDRLAAVVYRGTVYDHPLSGLPGSVQALTRDDLVGFYQSYYTLSGSRLIAVGDLDPEALVRDAEALFSALPPGPPARPEIRPAALSGVEVHIVDRPGSAQTELRIGHAGVPRSEADYIPLIVLNTLLGGKFTSRINLNLRERHGYTYGASSRFTPRLGPGPFLVDAAVATESAGAAAAETLGELRRIREDLVEPRELEETLSYVTGVFPYTFQTASDLAKRLETLAVYGLPDDYFERYLERLPTITREEILAVARRHIHPDHIAVVAVGPAEVLVPQLEPLGTVTVTARAD
jgi:predicted Zn-dependent peptidase